MSFSWVLCHIFQCGVNFVERINIKITKMTSFVSFSFIYFILLINGTHFCTTLTSTYAVLVFFMTYFFLESFNLWRPLLMIAHYHQTKTPISFWCRRGLNLRSLIQPSETLLVELTGTHHMQYLLIFVFYYYSTYFYYYL